MKLAKVVVSRSVLALVLGFCFVNSAYAETITIYTSPTIVDGAGSIRTCMTSTFSGVVSINIRYMNWQDISRSSVPERWCPLATSSLPATAWM